MEVAIVGRHFLIDQNTKVAKPYFGKQETVIDTATYIAPALPADPADDPIPDPNTGITQHYGIVNVGPIIQRNFFSVATAVIEIPDRPVGGEYETADVRLVIFRGGSDIIHKQKYYNVPVAPAR